MLIQDTVAPVSKVNVDSPVVDFHVDAANTQHIVYMMVNMYKDPVLAVVRELMSNAADEHARLKLTKKFKVILPNEQNPTFVVRDYAEGLPEEEVYRLITGIGSSGSYKRQDVHTTGGFGIGAKCPATITDQWMITSCHGGVMKVYSAFKGQTGNLQLTKLGEAPTGESGLEVSVPIDKRYLEAVKSKFLLAMQAYQPEERPEIMGLNTQLLDEKRPVFEGDNIQFYSDKHNRYGYGASLIVNRVKYPIDTAQFADGDKQVNFWLRNDICIRITDAAEKAVINVTPSREALIYTPQLKQLIITKLWNVGSIFRTEIQKKLDVAESFIAAQQIRHQFSGSYYRYMVDDMLPLTFRGREFKFTDALDFTQALNTTSAFWVKTLPELYKMTKLSLEDRLPSGVFGSVVKSRPHSCLGLGPRTQVPITSEFTWYINDIPKTWKHVPRKYINAIKELNNAPHQRFVIVNDIPGFLDHLDTFFPELSKSFTGRLSEIKLWDKKERARTSKASDGKPAVKRVKLEVIGAANAKFCRIDEEALAQGDVRGIPTWVIKSLTGKTIYTVLDNMIGPEYAYGYSDNKVVNVQLKTDYYNAYRIFAETFNKAAGIQANLISVSKSYYESAGVPDGWVQLHEYVKTEIPAQLKSKKHSKLFAELLDLTTILLFETNSSMWKGANTAAFSSQNGLPAVELIKLISKYADNNPNLKFKNSKIRDICAEFKRRTRAITLGIISKDQMFAIMHKVLISTSRYQTDAAEIRNFFKLTESEFEDITKSTIWDHMVNSACDTDLDFKLAMLATYIEADSPRNIYKTAFQCADKIKTVMISEMFKPKNK